MQYWDAKTQTIVETPPAPAKEQGETSEKKVKRTKKG